MTRDDILLWVWKAGGSSKYVHSDSDRSISMSINEITRFAALVAAHERAACAAICDEESRGINPKYGKIMAMMLGERIRGRGDA